MAGRAVPGPPCEDSAAERKGGQGDDARMMLGFELLCE